MIDHSDLGEGSFERLRKLKEMIDNGDIALAGNKRLKIYGTLSCKSGKRMLHNNRTFFSSENEAINHGFRPCGHCMAEKYKKWKITI